ncbi:hypothetical protein DACRYDRAFT_44770 [Dacryopinax primogenitus]|uniref:SNARE-complex protein Syntaxin-18 N-terminal domain-containing protein n=1 Tax=Dacryopinax primogenitus (strain DJM 731) TaxID=1858805 RepID=M5GGX5_DACPD|nr:uncharacterized protein DACRYDRAFT_44770 [Dacryopinax primogenitus]EJU06248.1 hypothetical protein DACRYDRAFT_44770 [Dacryopinax primogenitus]
MVAIDITADFRASVGSALKLVPDTKRRHKPRVRNFFEVKAEKNYAQAYLKEAYAILEHINTLDQMLASIRHAYLSVDSSHSHTRRGGFDASQKEGWGEVKRLTNQERDEIELQAKVILKRCAERVKHLEELEEKRASTQPSKHPLARLLPPRLLVTPSTSGHDVLAAHYAGITWYLNRKLASSSGKQREMQEERVRRQLERARSLGSEVAAVGPVQGDVKGEQVRRFDPTLAGRGPSYANGEEDTPLTAAQALLFEQENAAILRSAESVLAQVQRAEASLSEIGALQSELVHHLTMQTEMTDRLFEEAVATQAEVERGNQQLKRAKERGGDARRWLLVFLIGATLALLFLHYYSS